VANAIKLLELSAADALSEEVLEQLTEIVGAASKKPKQQVSFVCVIY
jgi:hypothetical protein